MAYRLPEPLEQRHRLEGFRSEEPALDERLKRHARQAHASGTARVYVATTVEDAAAAVGYFALAAASVSPVNATARAIKGQPPGRPVPAILLARLARDVRHKGSGLGPSLLQDALLRSSQAAETIGARVLLVHAKHERAKAFYARYGFEESPTDPLHLLMLMKDVRGYVKRVARPSP